MSGMGNPPGGWARCNLDGRTLSPGDQRALADFAETLRASKADPAVRWAELVEGEPPGTFWRVWHCSPPASPGQDQRDFRGQWDQPAPDGIPVWRIDEIQVPDRNQTGDDTS